MPILMSHDTVCLQRRIIQDMIEQDGLCIMAAGLGWQKVLAVMLQLQAERRMNPKERGVLLLLGCTDWQRSMIKQELRRLNPAIKRARAVNVTGRPVTDMTPAVEGQITAAEDLSSSSVTAAAAAAAAGHSAPSSDGAARLSSEVEPVAPTEGAAAVNPAAGAASASDVHVAADSSHDMEMPVDVTNEISAAGRIELYRGKACLFVTTRILVVDMLNSRVLPNQIAGMIVMNAHRVTETSGEGFAARLYRSSNRKGYLRAFSDQPTSFSHGFAKVCPSQVSKWSMFVLRTPCTLTDSMAAHSEFLSILTVMDQIELTCILPLLPWVLHRYCKSSLVMTSWPGKHDCSCSASLASKLHMKRRCLQVEKVMRSLFFQSLYLWPRFEAHVKECLKASEEGHDFEV